jgi:hypothetical protein
MNVLQLSGRLWSDTRRTNFIKRLLVWGLVFLFASVSIGLAADKTGRIADPQKPIGVNLRKHEGWGGHTIKKHCGKNDAYLIKRLKKESRIPAATTFTNEKVAKKSIDQVLKKQRTKVASWWNSGKGTRKAFFATVSTKGRVITRKMYEQDGQNVKSKPVKNSKVRVVLKRDSGGWFVLTAFPDP